MSRDDAISTTPVSAKHTYLGAAMNHRLARRWQLDNTLNMMQQCPNTSGARIFQAVDPREERAANARRMGGPRAPLVQDVAGSIGNGERHSQGIRNNSDTYLMLLGMGDSSPMPPVAVALARRPWMSHVVSDLVDATPIF